MQLFLCVRPIKTRAKKRCLKVQILDVCHERLKSRRARFVSLITEQESVCLYLYHSTQSTEHIYK